MSLKSFRKQSVKSKAFSTGVAGGTGVVPVINSVIVTDSSYNPLDDTALNPAGGYAKIIGENFEQTAIVYFNGIALTTTFVSSREMRIQTPAITVGSYNLMLFNLSTGQGAIFLNLAVSNFPTITTPSGVIQEQYESNQINAAIAATGDSALTYSIVPGSGDLPPGITLSSNGVLSGTAPVINSTTNYTFVVNVKDAQNQDSTRQFTLTIKMDVLTWNSPGINNQTYSTYEYTSLSPVTLNVTSAAGKPITYYSYNLPTGLSISGNTLSGTPTVAGTSSATINADCTATSKYTSRNINIQVNPDVVTWSAPTSNQTFTAYEYTQFSPITLSSTSAAGFSTSYSASGLPSGITLSGNTISGSTSTVGTTAVTLTSTATTTNRSATRSINLQVNPDSVTWSAPNPGAVFTAYEYTAFTPVTLSSSSAAGFSTSYSASGLPSGLTLSGNTISGTVNTVGTSSVTLTSTAATTNRSATRSVSFQVNPDVVTWSSPADATVYTNAAQTPIGNVTLSASSAAGFGVTYSASALPTGVTLSNGVISGTPTVAGENISTTLTATAATTGRTATRQISWVINLSADFVWKNVSLLLSADTVLQTKSFVTDSSTNNAQITVVGDTRPTNFNPYQPGYYSVQFDGTSSSYVSIPHNSKLSIMSGDTNTFIAECFAYWNIVNASMSIMDKSGRNTISFENWSVRLNASKQFQLIWGASGTPGSSAIGTLNTSIVPVSGVWYHIALVKSNADWSLFINGSRATTFNGLNTANDANPAALRIGLGIGGEGSAAYMSGYISNVRVWNGPAASAPYSATSTTITVPTAPFVDVTNTGVITCNSERAKDTSSYNAAVTIGSSTKISSAHNYSTNATYNSYGSAYFDGTGDYLTVPDSAAFAFGTGNFTAEAWVYITNIASSPWIIGQWEASAGSDTNSSWQIATSGNKFTGYMAYNNSISQLAITGTTTVLNNTWYHVALVRNGTNAYLYVNGVQEGSNTAIAGNSLNNSTLPVSIGQRSGGTQYMSGYIADVRVSSSAVYTANFTPPAIPLTTTANTQLLTLQTNASHNSATFKDNSSFNNVITRTGNVTTGTSSPYGDNWSCYFDGNGDWLTVGSTPIGLPTATTPFTIEAWVYITAYTGLGIICTNYTSATPIPFALVLTNGTNTTTGPGGYPGLYYYTGAAWNYVAQCTSANSTALSLNTWHHVAGVYSGSTAKIFINGTETVSVNRSTWQTTASSAGGINIGRKWDTSTGAYFSGYISNARLVIGTALYTASFPVSTTPLTAVQNTTFLTCQTNKLSDMSVNNYGVTKNGDVAVHKFSPFSTINVPKYYSTWFNGTSDYLTAPATSAAFGTGPWTIELWFCLNSLSAASVLVDTRAAVSPNNGVQASVLADGSVYWFEGASTTVISLAAGTIVTNRWYHLALVRTGTGTNECALYLDGVLKANGTSALNHAGNIPWIGRNAAATQDYIKGSISNLRITKSAVYTGAFTPSTSPLTTTSQSVTASNVTLLTCQSSTLIDNSTNNYAITSGTTTVRPYNLSPFTATPSDAISYDQNTFGSSMYFDGTGDYVSTPYSGSYDINTGDFTVEAWVYRNVAGAEHNIFVTRSSAGTDGWNLRINVANTLQFYYTGGGTLTSTGTIPANVWTHVAACKSGTTLRLFINGVQDGSNTAIGTGTTNIAATLRIGVDNSSAAGYMNGYISDARIIKGTALYTTNFYPPTSPITSTSTVLVSGNGSGIIDASRTIDLESVGDVRVTADSSPYTGKNSYFFDGTGDYIQSHTASGVLNFGTGDFTIETWVKFTANNGTYNPFLRLDAGTLDFGYDFSTSQLKYNTSVAVIAASWTPTVGQWYHIALVRSAGYAKIYVNGTNVAAANGVADSYNHNYMSSTSLFRIGGSSFLATHVLKGYLSDLRVTRGNARTITVPTAPYITK